MTHQGAHEFVEEWISENIQFEPYLDEESPDPRPAEFAAQCISAADDAGISQEEIESEYGDLKGRMAEAINASADAEVDRMMSKDRD
jgi:hypothetical protein